MALEVGSTIIKTIGKVRQAKYQQQVAENNAAIAEDNARRKIFESQIAAQAQDVQARGELGQLLAQQGASGLSLGSGSFALRRQGAEELAAKDRGFIRTQGEVQAVRFRQQAADFSAAGSMAKFAGRMAIAEGAFDIGSSLVSAATGVNVKTAQGIVS